MTVKGKKQGNRVRVFQRCKGIGNLKDSKYGRGIAEEGGEVKY